MSSPSGVRGGPRPPQGFPLILGLRMASPDTIMLLIVDYLAAIVGRGGSNKLRMSEGDVSHVSPSGGELMRELLLSSPV